MFNTSFFRIQNKKYTYSNLRIAILFVIASIVLSFTSCVSKKGYKAYYRAIEAQQNGNYQKACNYYEQAVNADPENSLNNHDEIYIYWGNSLFRLAGLENSKELYESSIEKYKKATELNPNNFDAYFNWGISLYFLARWDNNKDLYEASIEKYKKATELNPSSYTVYYFWGLALFGLVKLENNNELYEASIEKSKKATELDPNFSEAYDSSGYVLLLSELSELSENNKELYKKSIKKYEKAIELNPNDSEAYTNLGGALIGLAELENNIEEYKNDIFEVLLKAENHEEGSGAYNLACLHSLLNEKDTAFKYLKSALWMKKTPSRDYIEKDTDFDNLKSDPRFEELLNKYFPKGKN